MSGRGVPDLSLYLVTSSELAGRGRLVDTVVAATTGGVSLVQLREPDASDADVVALGRDLVAALAPTGVPLLINDRVHLVEEIGAAGAHVGQDDLDPVKARELIGPDRWLGQSVQTVEQARAAAESGEVDYLGIGPAWPTATKQVTVPPLLPAGVRTIAHATELPSVAIGGIGVDEVPQLRTSGISGVAVVSAICGRLDPRGEATRLRAAWETGIAL